MRHINSHRLAGFDYSTPGSYFITFRVDWALVKRLGTRNVCGRVVNGTVCLNEIGSIAHACLRWLVSRYPQLKLDEFVVMPDHLHAVLILDYADCTGNGLPVRRKSLGRMIGAFKTRSSSLINSLQGTPGTRVWARDFYDHIVRDQVRLERIRAYIRRNPMAWEERAAHGQFGNICYNAIQHTTGVCMPTPTTARFILPFDLAPGSSVLVAGAGGGFDFLCGLPIASALLEAGHEVHLANYSFTDLGKVTGGRWTDELILTVDRRSRIVDAGYFPEMRLSEWYHERHGREMPIHCFPRIGIRPLAKAYGILKDRLQLHAVIVVDGGVDGIFRGDEHDLGTPSMDSASVIAGSLSGIDRRFYVMTAFGSEGVAKEVSHADVLARVADLTRQNAFLGASAVTGCTLAGNEFIDAISFINGRIPAEQHGNIPGSIAAAIRGSFGDTAFNLKTKQNPIWISALTSLVWFFDLDAVARLKLFYADVVETDTIEEIAESLQKMRKNKHFERHSIPI